MARRYSLGKRRVSVEVTRARVLETAIALLSSVEGPAAFSLQAVARESAVARMTVYYQFGSRRGLVAAVIDAIVRDGLAPQVKAAFDVEDPEEALRRFVGAYCAFWHERRALVRGIRALGIIDPETGADVRRRDLGRRLGLTLLLSRRARARGLAPPGGEVVDLAWVLTGFESVEALLGQDRDPEAVAALVLAAL